MARRRKGRVVNGVLLLNKASAISSNKALQSAKRLFAAQKAGHTGSLDPLATGLLPICFGEATKFSHYLLNADKAYQASIILGQTTTTADADGELLSTQDVSHLRLTDVEQVLPQFMGEIQQIPPMYSALKHQGQPLYKLARQGIMLEREPRSVTIHALELKGFEAAALAALDINVVCSKGTYIRSLAVDIGSALEVGAHIKHLHRTHVGEFSIQNALSLAELETLGHGSQDDVYRALEQCLLPLDCMLRHLPCIALADDLGEKFHLGQTVYVPNTDVVGTVKVVYQDESLIGVGELDVQGMLSPKRLLAQQTN